MPAHRALSYEIRAADSREYAQVADLLVRVYVGEGFTPPESAASLADVAGRAATSEVIVASEAGTVIGAVFLVLDGPLRQIAGPQEAEIRTLAVDPAVRGRGVGEALVRACIERASAAGCEAVSLSTQPTMTAAQRLYDKLGFTRVPERDWHRRTGTPMLAFTLQHPVIAKQARKVAAFIVRDAPAGPELLVFHHDRSGLQIPAGTVEDDEAPDAAVRREVREEAGLDGVHLEYLGTRAAPYAGDECVVATETDLLADPAPGSRVIRRLGRGWVRRLGTHGTYTHVHIESLDYDLDPPRPIGPATEGWVASGVLWTGETRSFYLARVTTPLPDTWTIRAEQTPDFDGYEFRFRWLPLTRDVALIGAQRAWVEEFWDRLTTRELDG